MPHAFHQIMDRDLGFRILAAFGLIDIARHNPLQDEAYIALNAAPLEPLAIVGGHPGGM